MPRPIERAALAESFVDRLLPPSRNTSSYTPLYSLSSPPKKVFQREREREFLTFSLRPRAFNPRFDSDGALSFPDRDKAESNEYLLKEQ